MTVSFNLMELDAGGGYSPQKRYLSPNGRRLQYLCKLLRLLTEDALMRRSTGHALISLLSTVEPGCVVPLL